MSVFLYCAAEAKGPRKKLRCIIKLHCIDNYSHYGDCMTSCGTSEICIVNGVQEAKCCDYRTEIDEKRSVRSDP